MNEINKVNDKWVWLLAFSPIFAITLQLIIFYLTNMRFEYLYFILALISMFLVYKDQAYLISCGIQVDKLGSPTLIPIYLYKRTNLFDSPPFYLLIWGGLFFSALFLPQSFIISVPYTIFNSLFA